MHFISTRRDFFSVSDGPKAPPVFSIDEYERRLARLRQILVEQGLDAVVLTSMHNVAYYCGFLYCSFGRPYGCVVSATRCVSISASIDAAQPWRRSIGENLVYTDWRRDNFERAVAHVLGPVSGIGIEGDHVTLSLRSRFAAVLAGARMVDVAAPIMAQRILKSREEIALIEQGAQIADLAGAAMREAIAPDVTELDVAVVGRAVLEQEIARRFPDSELRDSWVWFQSGPNTDGAHNPLTTRRLRHGDLLSLNAFPMISGYYTALERTLFLGDPDAATLRVWQANVAAHELGLSLIAPGRRCSEICAAINDQLAEDDLLRYRTFGYGHSFGLLSHYYGREAGLELREDVDTELLPGMVVSMEPMLCIPQGQPGAGGYREHDILVVTTHGARNITRFPYGPEHHVIDGITNLAKPWRASALPAEPGHSEAYP